MGQRHQWYFRTWKEKQGPSSIRVTPEVMEKGVPDPNLGDNNDGITVVDFTGDKPAYAFVLLEDETGYAPLTGEQYVLGYYSRGDDLWRATRVDELDTYIKSSAGLLTIERLARLFPKTWAPVMAERRAIQKDPRNIPVMLADGLVYKAANQAFAESILKGG